MGLVLFSLTLLCFKKLLLKLISLTEANKGGEKNVKRQTVILATFLIAVFATATIFADVAAANNQPTETHSSYAMGASDKEKPNLALTLNNTAIAVNTSVTLYGALATGEQGTLHYIGGATITIQQLNYDGTAWNKLGTLQTLTGKEAGFFAGSVTPNSKGYYIVRATYDGDSNYAPTVGNVAVLIVY